MTCILSRTGGIIGLVVFAILSTRSFAQAASSAPRTTTTDTPPCQAQPNVQNPEHMVRPKYPKQSLQAGSEGSVELRAVVDSEGRTRSLTVVNGLPILATPSLQAVRKWRFHPVLAEGRPVETTYKIRMRFVLLLEEAIPDWEVEVPRETAPMANSFQTASKHETPDGPVYSLSENSGIVPPKQTYAPEPEFSEKARKVAEQGTVTLSLVVGTDGRPRDIAVYCSSAPDLNENAIEAVKTWKFEPGTKDGLPVMVQIGVEVQFHLDNNH